MRYGVLGAKAHPKSSYKKPHKGHMGSNCIKMANATID